MPNNTPESKWDQYEVSAKPNVPEEWEKYLISDKPSVPYEWSKYEEKPSPFMQKADAFNKAIESAGLPALGGGIIQGGAEGLMNIANLVPGVNLKYPEALKPSNVLPDSSVNRIMAGTGKVGGEIMAGGGALKALRGAPLIGKSTSLPMDILRSALAGYGVSSEEQPGGRIGGAVAGAGGSALGSLFPSSIMKKIGGEKEPVTSKFSSGYKNLFKDSSSGVEGTPSVRIPSALHSQETQEALKYLPLTARRAISSFKKSPTLENAHKAQSEVQAGVRSLERQGESLAKKGQTLGMEKSNAIKGGTDARKRIQGEMQRTWVDSGNPHLAERYGNLTQEYAKEAVPLKEGAIHKYLAGDMRAKKALKELQGSKAFGESIYPSKIGGYKSRELIEPAIPWAKRGAGALAVEEALRHAALPYITPYLQKILSGG